MKKILIAVLLLASFTAQAQSKKALLAGLKQDLEVYKRVSLKMNYDSIFSFMPPAFFDIVNKDTLVAMMANLLETEDYTMKITQFDFPKKLKIKSTNGYHYALVPYTGSMDIQMKKENETFFNIMKNVMGGQFGKDNVKVDGNKMMHIAMVDKVMIAFKPKNNQHWYLLEDKRGEKGQAREQQAVIMEAVIPEEVRKAMDAPQ
jgi:hypothetical protein